MSFESDLAKFLGRPSVQKKITAVAVKNIRAGGVGVAGSKAEAEKWVEKAKTAIIQSLPDALRHSAYHEITEQDLLVHYLGISDEGKFQFAMSWNPWAVHRESLYSGGYPEGVEDIVGLFHSGYSANNYVYGYWKSRQMHGINAKYRSRGFRDPDPFLINAIAKFNAENRVNGVELTLDPLARNYR